MEHGRDASSVSKVTAPLLLWSHARDERRVLRLGESGINPFYIYHGNSYTEILLTANVKLCPCDFNIKIYNEKL